MANHLSIVPPMSCGADASLRSAWHGQGAVACQAGGM